MIIGLTSVMTFILPANRNEISFSPARRNLMSGAAALVLTALAGCGSLPRQGPGGGASTASRQTMDGIRTAEGLALISPDHQLEQAALQQAQYMAASGRMNHTTGFGKDFQARVKSNGIRGAAAENIAEGRMDAARAIDMWMNSPPHRRNMLDGRFRRFGLAWATRPERPEWRYWAMILAS